MVYILVQLLLKLTRKNILIILKDAKLTLILGLHNLWLIYYNYANLTFISN
jgi:hypothetical protein